MMQLQALLEKLWQQYSQEIEAAHTIHTLLEKAGEQVVNDHIAFRTFDDPRVNIDVLAQPFLACGYVEKGGYDFPVQKLFAKHYEHPSPEAPKIFISQLLALSFSDWLHEFVIHLVDQIPKAILSNPERLLRCGTPWLPLDYKHYERLLAESQYAAWMYVFGFRVNHFTVSVNHLKQYNSIQKMNVFLKENGFTLNTEGGEVKGSPDELLEQSSILAEHVPVEFADGIHQIPSCYYEFALRYKDQQGNLYQGFVPTSADKLFKSTHTRPK